VNLLAEAQQAAKALDQSVSAQLRTRRLESAKRLFFRLRSYLYDQCKNNAFHHDIYSKIKFQSPDKAGMALITLGPSIDKETTEDHIHFESGSRLSFGITIREVAGSSELVSYRFHHAFTSGHSPAFLRFDLNGEEHSEPLREPRSHLHPGIESVRMPTPVLHPVEILDRVFFAIEASVK